MYGSSSSNPSRVWLSPPTTTSTPFNQNVSTSYLRPVVGRTWYFNHPIEIVPISNVSKKNDFVHTRFCQCRHLLFGCFDFVQIIRSGVGAG